MAKISKQDLEHLSKEQIKEFYTNENLTQFHISPIKEYIEGGRDNFERGYRIVRVEKLLNIIVIERFVRGTL